jgi:ABC-type Na+ efflux pump permease subunit
VRAAHSIASERVNQTLEVLLTTPISGRDIVRHKVHGAWRFSLVLAVPIATVILLEAWAEGGAWRGYHEYSRPAYVAMSLIPIVIFFPMLTWLATLLGLRMRTRGRATILSVVLVTAWVLLPFLVLILIGELFRLVDVDALPGSLLFLLSPGLVVFFPEIWEIVDDLYGNSYWWAFGLAYVWYALLWFGFRWLCLRKADAWLGRTSAPRRSMHRAPPPQEEEG